LNITASPGTADVRELKNLVKKGIIAAKAKKEEIISIDMLEVINNKLQVGSGGRLFSVDCSTVNYQEGMATLEKGLLEQLVKMADSNIKRAIDLSGMAKTTLYRRMAIHGIKLLEN
jgi:DNA-binding NtrC family response regulator